MSSSSGQHLMRVLSRLPLKAQNLAIVAMGVLGAAGGITYQMFSQAGLAQKSTEALIVNTKNVNGIGRVSVLFKSEVQAWKDILLRGADPAKFAKYSAELDQTHSKIVEKTQMLEKGLQPPGVELAEKFLKSEQELVSNYQRARSQYLTAGHFDPGAADVAVVGMDRKVLDGLQELNKRLEERMEQTSSMTVETLHSGLRRSLISSIAMTGLILAIAWWLVSGISSAIAAISDRMAESSSALFGSSQALSSSSEQLSSSSTQAAASLEETASSIDEVSAMVQKNAESAKQCQEASESGKQVASQGKEAVTNVIAAIDDIQGSNSEVVNQLKESNQELGQVVRVINEIDQKTKVINEIVFQTKLLSFNASVEAARAGEHGKGFAVVAEEVGNLAQMSGNAAKEITSLLEKSTRQVEQIVKTNQSRAESLISKVQSTIDQGKTKATRCGEVLDQVLASVQTISEMSDGISIASQEQARGIQEITKAINELNQVTFQNSSISENTSDSAENLSIQANGLHDLVDQLMSIVHGSGWKMRTPGDTQDGEQASPPAATEEVETSDLKIA